LIAWTSYHHYSQVFCDTNMRNVQEWRDNPTAIQRALSLFFKTNQIISISSQYCFHNPQQVFEFLFVMEEFINAAVVLLRMYCFLVRDPYRRSQTSISSISCLLTKKNMMLLKGDTSKEVNVKWVYRSLYFSRPFHPCRNRIPKANDYSLKGKQRFDI